MKQLITIMWLKQLEFHETKTNIKSLIFSLKIMSLALKKKNKNYHRSAKRYLEDNIRISIHVFSTIGIHCAFIICAQMITSLWRINMCKNHL